MLGMLRRSVPGGLVVGGAATLAGWQLLRPDVRGNSLFTAHAEAPTPKAPSLNPADFQAIKLKQKEKLNHNTVRYIFDASAGLPVASCLLVRALLKEKPEDAEPKPVIRPYTPTSSADAADGLLELVVKSYPTGKMSKHMETLKVGDTLDIKGPIPKFKYEANSKKQIGMIAGGTGITPMWQVAQHIVANPDDKTQVSLVFGNLSEDDILIKDLLDGLAKQDPKRFKVHYIVDKPKNSWTWRGGVGFITADVIKKHLPAPGPDTTILVCGPPGLLNAISGQKESPTKQGELKGALKDLGYTAEQVYKF